MATPAKDIYRRLLSNVNGSDGSKRLEPGDLKRSCSRSDNGFAAPSPENTRNKE